MAVLCNWETYFSRNGQAQTIIMHCSATHILSLRHQTVQRIVISRVKDTIIFEKTYTMVTLYHSVTTSTNEVLSKKMAYSQNNFPFTI